MRSRFILASIIGLAVTVMSSTCETPLVDYDTVLNVRNEKPDTILVYIGESNVSPPTLPTNPVETYAPIAPSQTGFIAIHTEGSDLFEDLPSGVLEVWVFDAQIFRNTLYDTLRADTALYDLYTFTAAEFEAVRDTLVIE